MMPLGLGVRIVSDNSRYFFRAVDPAPSSGAAACPGLVTIVLGLGALRAPRELEVSLEVSRMRRSYVEVVCHV